MCVYIHIIYIYIYIYMLYIDIYMYVCMYYTNTHTHTQATRLQAVHAWHVLWPNTAAHPAGLEAAVSAETHASILQSS